MTSRLTIAAALALALVVGACSGGGGGDSNGAVPTNPTNAELRAQGGTGTVDNKGSSAFAQGMPGLDSEQRRAFAVGNSFFNQNWVTAPASTTGRDGLGPIFNAQSCSSCHFEDGRGRPPYDDDDPERGLLLRLSVLDAAGDPVDDVIYGGQFQDRSIRGVPAEGAFRIALDEHTSGYPDGTEYSLAAPTYELETPEGEPIEGLMVSPRIAPGLAGMGLLENVPAEDIEALADPDDDDGDGISGRVNRVIDPETGELALGRFGWKANVATLNAQNTGAFAGDIGITSSIVPNDHCTEVQSACGDAANGGDPEFDDAKLDRITFYTQTLAVPARRDVGDEATVAGQETFGAVGCADCHTERLETGPSDIAPLSDQMIRPYTDLLLHDMGPDLADGRPDGEASGSEWRTPPLWGIGLVETVNGHTRFLHDGRARSIEEAILWHGGEAEPARDAFMALPADERDAVLTFLESL